MKPKVIRLLILLGVAIGSYALGRYIQPEKVVVETKEVQVEKVRTEYKTVVRTVTRPDGTKETEETKEIVRDSENSSSRDQRKEVANKNSEWKAGLLLGATSLDIINDTAYGVHVERRILGPVFAGLWGTSSDLQKTLGVSVSLEF